MPLSASTLENALKKFMDKGYTGFSGFPVSNTDAAEAIASAVNNYASTIFPVSTVSAAAKEEMLIKLQNLGENEQGQKMIEDGIDAYAKKLATGMAGYTANSPAVPLDLTAVGNMGINNGTSAGCASLFSTIVDTWFKTGTASLNGAISNWK